ncbi:MAG TPA: DUF4386 domain-containing protein [Chloroflexota bacterium]|nr:DUF4386 domain-containing protein [Chloroflexota bacterium]HUM69025.1 DUF4386 domain-containing protein [Chloroflexota bacterium]
MNSEKKTARVTGILYLIIFFANIYVFFGVTGSLVVPGDATATANNIIASESMYRSGIASYLLVFLSEIGVAILLYKLVKPVNATLSLMAMATRLMQAAVHAVNLVNFVIPLLLLSGAESLNVFEPAQLQALAQFFLDTHYYGVLISEAFFSASLLLLGYLVYKSELFPGILGVGLAIAGLFYILDSFGIFLMPQHQEFIAQIIVAPAVIAEMSFILYLLVKGVRTPKQGQSAPMKTTTVEGMAV